MFFLRHNRVFHFFSTDIRTTVVSRLCSHKTGLDYDDMVKAVGLTPGEQKLRCLLPPDQPENSRSMRVAIIGTPNAGKSTMINSLLGWRVMPCSKKVHTTRNNMFAVWTEKETQIIFTDTPGVITNSSRRKHKLEKSLLLDPEQGVQEADLIGVIVDVSNKWTRSTLDQEVLKLLHLHQHVPSFLVLNKVDAIKSREALLNVISVLSKGIVGGVPVKMRNQILTRKLTLKQEVDLILQKYEVEQDEDLHTDSINKKDTESEEYLRNRFPDIDFSLYQKFKKERQQDRKDTSEVKNTSASLNKSDVDIYLSKVKQVLPDVQDEIGWQHFEEVFVMSALKGEGVDSLRDYLLKKAPPGDWDYNSRMVTDQDPHDIVIMCVWTKILDHLNREVPYVLDPIVTYWDEDEESGAMDIVVEIRAFNNRQMGAIIGKKGETIQNISSEAERDIMNTFRCDVKLSLRAKLVQMKKKG